jgi:protein involved in polysaccharide export with SLBB domain
MRCHLTIFLFLLVAAPAGFSYAADVDLLSYDRIRESKTSDASPVSLQNPAAPVEQPKAMLPLAVQKVVSMKPKNLRPASPPANMLKLHDDLHIVVEGEPDLSGSYTIAQDGTVTLPLVGTIKADGRTLQGLQSILIAKYKDGYLVNPVIRVTRGAGR